MACFKVILNSAELKCNCSVWLLEEIGNQNKISKNNCAF